MNDLQNTTDYNRFFLEFGNVSLQSQNLNFSPPINMYRALTIALESDDWNASSLSTARVDVSLEYMSSNDLYGNNFNSVTEPAKDYSLVQANGWTYRYIMGYRGRIPNVYVQHE